LAQVCGLGVWHTFFAVHSLFFLASIMTTFQVKLGGAWKDYSAGTDNVLRHAFMSGLREVKIHNHGKEYICNFERMVQINTDTKAERSIRPPQDCKPPSKTKSPVESSSKAKRVPPGETTVLNVPPGAQGSTIHIPHPKVEGAQIAVNVSATARDGQAMLVPVPSEDELRPVSAASKSQWATGKTQWPKEWTYGAKIASGAAGVAAIGGLAVGGAMFGESVASHGFDATIDAIGDGFEDAGDFIVDTADDVGGHLGDFLADLF